MDKALLLARRRLQEESALDPSVSQERIDGIASAFGGKAATVPQRKASEKKSIVSGMKETVTVEKEENPYIPEDLAKRLAARRLAVDKAINDTAETIKENIPKSLRGQNESTQLLEVFSYYIFGIKY